MSHEAPRAPSVRWWGSVRPDEAPGRTLDAARSWTAEPVSAVIYITLQ
jgi:hypothetical protein